VVLQATRKANQEELLSLSSLRLRVLALALLAVSGFALQANRASDPPKTNPLRLQECDATRGNTAQQVAGKMR
jgi:hypothetical protein